MVTKCLKRLTSIIGETVSAENKKDVQILPKDISEKNLSFWTKGLIQKNM